MNPDLPEPTRYAFALLKAHVTADQEAWEALRDLAPGQTPAITTALCQIAGVALQHLVPAEAHHDRHLDPQAVDAALLVLADAFRPADQP